MNIPKITGEHHERLLSMMNPGASADNPIDLIATATNDQLDRVIEYVDRQMPGIDGMSVIFGSNGLNDMTVIYDLLSKKIQECNKPLFPILPSVASSHAELEYFLSKGHINFPDEVVLGRALTKISNTPYPAEEKIFLKEVNVPLIREIIDKSPNGYLDPDTIQKLLSAANIPTVKEAVVKTKKEIASLAEQGWISSGLKDSRTRS